MARDPRRGAGRHRGTVRPALVIVLSVACAIGPLAVLSGSGASYSPAVGPGEATLPTEENSSFALRAGYSPEHLSELVGARAASGEVPVELTFSRPLSPAAYDAALGYFGRQGLVVTASDPDRLSVGLEGKATAVGKAFSTNLLAGTYQGSPVILPARPPSLPSGLQSEVAGVVGLSSGFTSFSFDLWPISPGGLQTPSATGLQSSTVTPALAREFYGFSTLFNLTGGHNNTTYPVLSSIAIVLWGAGYSPGDISSFLQEYYPSPPFPMPKINNYPVAGAQPPTNNAPDSADSRAVEELTLDIEWAISMAPGATIDVVYAPGGPAPGFSPSAVNLTAALSWAVTLDPTVISMSFGTNESTDASLLSSWTPLLQQAASQGTTVVAATGDTGGDTTNIPACSGKPAPEYPASSPQVLSVGGTKLSVSYPLGGGVTFSETGWSGSGGGFSTQFSAPSWQEVGSAAAPISANGHRGMPDVSASAANDFLYFNGTTGVAAGTSFATPLWAGLVADIDAKWGHSLGFFTPSLYHVGASEPTGTIGVGLANVTGGANCVGNASVGWNEVTGWGSPRAAVLYDDLLGSFVNITLNVDRTTVAPGGSVSVTAQLTNRTTGAPIAGVAVDLSVAADTDLGPCTGTFGTASPTTNASGWVAARLSVPICYLGQHALLNATVATTKLYGTSGLRLDVNLLGLAPALTFLTQAPWAYLAYSVIVGAAVVAGAWIGRPKEPAARPAPPAAFPSGTAPPSPPTPPTQAPPPASPPSGEARPAPVVPSPSEGEPPPPSQGGSG